MLIYNVFGRTLAVKREGEHWLLFRADLTEGKFSRIYDIIIPDDMAEHEIAGWLNDIFHEAATMRNPQVIRIN